MNPDYSPFDTLTFDDAVNSCPGNGEELLEPAGVVLSPASLPDEDDYKGYGWGV